MGIQMNKSENDLYDGEEGRVDGKKECKRMMNEKK
jgi:hypothetical protein